MSPRFAYLYFMRDDPDRIRATVASHVSHWQQQNLPAYLGGPFEDRSGGLITFQAEDVEQARHAVDTDSFMQEGLWRPTGSSSGCPSEGKEVLSMVTQSDKWPMHRHTVLVTGGTGGIGYHTARFLARWGAQVLITGRETATGEQAAAAIRRESGQELVRFLQADHATVGGNHRLANRVRAAVPGLDVLVNNVGGLYQTRWETADGYEATLAMNFLGPFALTRELLPLLQANAPARCLNVVSAAFKMWKPDPLQDLQSMQHYVSGDA